MWWRALLLFWLAVFPWEAQAADPLRVAMFNTELDRDGPGLLLRDIGAGAPDVLAVAAVIRAARPDILVITRFDYDHGLLALGAFNALLGDAAFPHLFALRPNTGRPTGQDLDRDGRLGEPEDAQGFGEFSGQNGMAILSRLPIDRGAVQDFSPFLWHALPEARLPMEAGVPFWPAPVTDTLPLASVAAWDVPVILPGGGRLHVLAFHASPPVFDGPEDRNGLRAADELRFWQVLLDGGLPMTPPAGQVVLAGTANIDPERGDGRHEAIRALLADPHLQDAAPASSGGTEAGAPVATADLGEGLGPLRLDYVLPGAGIEVRAAGVFWPARGTAEAALLGADGLAAGRHRLVWVDLAP